MMITKQAKIIEYEEQDEEECKCWICQELTASAQDLLDHFAKRHWAVSKKQQQKKTEDKDEEEERSKK
jgi:hypothetical protein